MNLPLKPLTAAGQTFASSAPLVIITYLMGDGWTMTRDEPGLVELTRGREYVRIDADGQVTPQGNDADKTAHGLLMLCEEQS